MNVRLVDGAELQALAPALTPSAVAAAYTPEDGQAHPPSTTLAFAAAAQRHGASYATGVRVDQFLRAGERISGLEAAGDSVSAGWVVLAAGAWSSRLAASVGLELPIRTRAPQMLLTDAGPPQLAPTITAARRALSLKQLPSGAFFIGGGWPSDVLSTDMGPTCRVREASVAGSWVTATAVVPSLGQQRVVRSWCGVEAESFDGVPLIGPAPGLPGLYLALGFSGHGFQIAPAVGRSVADALQGRPTPELDGLAAARLQAFEPTAVAAFRMQAY